MLCHAVVAAGLWCYCKRRHTPAPSGAVPAAWEPQQGWKAHSRSAHNITAVAGYTPPDLTIDTGDLETQGRSSNSLSAYSGAPTRAASYGSPPPQQQHGPW